MRSIFTGYLGTYSENPDGKGRGIYTFSFNCGTGVMEDIHLAAEAVNPSWLAVAPSGKFLYVVNELNKLEEKPNGAVSAYEIGGDGSLRFLNSKSSEGKSPCHLAVDKDSTHVIATNYVNGTLSVLPLDKEGRLGNSVQVIRFKGRGPNRERQERSHAHSFMFAPDNRFGFACDLGADKVMIYQFDKNAPKPLSPGVHPFIQSEEGAGPRHGIFNPDGTIAYYINELDSTVDVLKYNEGIFEKIQGISALPGALPDQAAVCGSIAAAVRISADGSYLYSSNRGHDSIAVFKVLPGGLLKFIDAVSSEGKHPRDFIIDPSGNFLLVLNKDTDNMVISRINPKTGLFKKEREYPVPSPVSIAFLNMV
jgi:6-phosphogluconolactonase